MRKIFIITVITFMALSCNKKDDEGASKLHERKVADKQEVIAAQDSERPPEADTDDSSEKSEVDPVFKDYEYPASTLESTFSMGNTVSVIYNSPDDFSKVVEFYKQKFPDAPPQSDQPRCSRKRLDIGYR